MTEEERVKVYAEAAWKGEYDRLAAVVLAWLEDVENLPGAAVFEGPYTTATDRLVQMARQIRSDQTTLLRNRT